MIAASATCECPTKQRSPSTWSRLAVAEIAGRTLPPVPPTTAMGALVHHITGGAEAKTFQPMNVNFGLFPPVDGLRAGRRGRRDRYKAYTDRAKEDWTGWLANA